MQPEGTLNALDERSGDNNLNEYNLKYTCKLLTQFRHSYTFPAPRVRQHRLSSLLADREIDGLPATEFSW